jgi:uncharacterized membrane protein
LNFKKRINEKGNSNKMSVTSIAILVIHFLMLCYNLYLYKNLLNYEKRLKEEIDLEMEEIKKLSTELWS